MRERLRITLSLVGAVGMMLNGSWSRAGTVTYDFTTDPTNGVNAIEIYTQGFLNSAGESVYWKDAGGNPGGFLGLTWPIGSSTTIAIFPDIDAGKIVTTFTFDCDLRIGNPQQTARAADGFSINFARANDPVFENHSANDFATAGAVETGTQTGLAISFDTWSGNALPDGGDIEGIIVRVDNKTILRQPMATRNGACDDTTSLQTGPRQDAYWDDPDTGAKALGTLPDAAFLPETWTNLCWQHLSVELDTNAALTVTYKGLKVLDKFQTTFFPSAGRIVLAGRTGGADEHGHFDNLTLTTTASTSDTVKPTLPANLRTTGIGSYRVELAWDPSTDDSGRVGYDIEQDGVSLGTSATPAFSVSRLSPTNSYTFRVRATDVSGNKSEFISLQVTTVAEVLNPALAGIKIYGSTDEPISGAPIDGLLGDARYPDAPDRIAALKGMIMSFGEPGFGDTFGENLGFRIAGTLTPAGQYTFFVRSDDASQLYLNLTDATIPVADGTSQIAEETDCCGAFMESGVANADGTTFSTSAPISLTAGKAYGILFIVKEGGGGDWGQVAWRKAGDTNAAASLAPIGAPIFQSEVVPPSDPLDAAGPPPVGGIADGLVAYWNFNGNLFDSIDGFDGTAQGTNPVAFVDGKAGFGKSVKLDGTDQFVDITGNNENNLEFPRGSMSIAGWFKVGAFDTAWQALIAKGEDLNYRVARRDPGNTIAYAGGVAEGAADVPDVNDGQWHHFVAISDAATNQFGTALYLDGVRHGVNTNKPVLASNASHLYIGENPGAVGRQWNGEIDDIAIWKRVLTSEEISTLFNGGGGTPLSTLVVADQDVTKPGDTIVSSHAADRSPAAEQVANAIDNKSSTKYLNFGDGTDTAAPLTGITGFTVTPSAGSSVVTGIALTSANDGPERDPASYKLEGSSDGTTFTLVSEGTVGSFTNRFVRQKLHFANTNAFTSYRVTFPAVSNATTAVAMQIAEVELLGTASGGGGTGPSFTAISKQGNNVVMTWAPATAVLQSATVVTGPYTDVAGASGGTYTAPMTDAPRYFRLK